MRPLQRYWDSDCFLNWLNRDPAHGPVCDAIIRECKAGQCQLVTSTVTFSEVFYIRNDHQPIPLSKADQVQQITELFAYSWVVSVSLDKYVAELARDLLFEFGSDGLKPPDAIHLASAIHSRAIGRVERFETCDGVLHAVGKQLARLKRLKEPHSGADIIVGPPTAQLWIPAGANEPEGPSA